MKIICALFLMLVILFPAKVNALSPTHMVIFYVYNEQGGLIGHSSQRVAEGSYAIEPPVPQSHGFIFVGWSENPVAAEVELFDVANTPIDSMYTLFPVWRNPIFNIIIDPPNAGTVNVKVGSNEVIPPVSVAYDEQIYVEAIPARGYVFEKWSFSDFPDGDNTSFIPDLLNASTFNFMAGNYDIIYKAHFEPVTDALPPFVVTFFLDGGLGTAPPTQFVEHGELATEPPPPQPPSDFLLFDGWMEVESPTAFLPLGLFDFSTPIVKNTTLIANWRAHWVEIEIVGMGSVTSSYLPERITSIGVFTPPAGNDIDLLASPTPGWKFEKYEMFVNGIFVGNDIFANPWNFQMETQDILFKVHFVPEDLTIHPTILVVDVSDNMFGLPFMAMQHTAFNYIWQNTVAGVITFNENEASVADKGVNGYPYSAIASIPRPTTPSESGAKICLGLALAGELIEELIADPNIPHINTTSNVRVILLSRGLTQQGWGLDNGTITAIYEAAVLKSKGYTVESRGFFHAIGKSKIADARYVMTTVASGEINYIEYGSANEHNPPESPTIVTVDWQGEDFINLSNAVFFNRVISVLRGTDENGVTLPLASANIHGTPLGNIRQIGIFQVPLDMIQMPGEFGRGSNPVFDEDVPLELNGAESFPFNFGIVIGTGDLKNMFNENIEGNIAMGDRPNSGSRFGTYTYLGEKYYDPIYSQEHGTCDAIELSFTVGSSGKNISFDYFFASTEYDGGDINDVMGLWILGNAEQQSIENNIARMPDGKLVSIANTRPDPNINVWWKTGYTNGVKTYVPIGGRHSSLITQHNYRMPFAGRTTQFTAEADVPAGSHTVIRMAVANMDDGLLPSAVFIRGHSVNAKENREPAHNVILMDVSGGTNSRNFNEMKREVKKLIEELDSCTEYENLYQIVAFGSHVTQVRRQFHDSSLTNLDIPENNLDELLDTLIQAAPGGNDIHFALMVASFSLDDASAENGRIHLFSNGRPTLPRTQDLIMIVDDHSEPYTMHDYVLWRQANVAISVSKTIRLQYPIHTYVTGFPLKDSFERRFMEDLAGPIIIPEEPLPDVTIMGNILGSGRVTSADANALARYLAGYDIEICLQAADINGDGIVDITDLILLRQMLVGIN